LPLRLRTATAGAHRRLERDLDLLATPFRQQRFTVLLGRFWGFHSVWERSLHQHGALRGVMVDRSRLNLIETDLRALGMTQADIDALPLCVDAADLASSSERALGSVYVIEGSTLGGRMISRSLHQAAWVPPRGLRSFDPYGSRTGVMWRRFQATLNATSSVGVDLLVENGATSTFEMLHQWLVDH
jgi:heme oxygenase